MALGRENKSGSTRIENLFYKCNMSEPSTAGASSQYSRSSPLQPDFEEWESEHDDQIPGQTPFRHHVNGRRRDDANRDSGYGSSFNASPVADDYDRHHSPDLSPESHREQYHAHPPYGFHNRGGSDTAWRARNNAGNGEYPPRRDHPHERGLYEPQRNAEGYGQAENRPNRFLPHEGVPYGRERSPDRRPYAYTSSSPSVGPPSVPPDEGYYEDDRDRHRHHNANPDQPFPYERSDAETDRGREAYYGTGPTHPPPRERYDYEGTGGRNWFSDVGPDPRLPHQQFDAEGDRRDISSVASPPRPPSPEMNDGSSGTWSNVSTGNQSEDGARDVHRQCGINPKYIAGQRVCRVHKGCFCRERSAKRKSR